MSQMFFFIFSAQFYHPFGCFLTEFRKEGSHNEKTVDGIVLQFYSKDGMSPGKSVQVLDSKTANVGRKEIFKKN